MQSAHTDNRKKNPKYINLLKSASVSISNNELKYVALLHFKKLKPNKILK